ncbi:MAG: DUF1007 family protein [Deltaproteobacteria bacterium]|nr:DUF1007 family protein [Candidatus Zymogenaceae bacterium]
MKKKLLSLLAAFLFCVHAGPVLSHPHVFIDAELVFVFDDGGLVGIRERWVFDEMFSQGLLSDFGAEDGRLTNETVVLLRDIFYENTRDYNYYNILTIDGQEHTIESLRDFSVYTEDYRIVYEFFVPCRVAAPPSGEKRVQVLLFDETIYTHLTIAEYRMETQSNHDALVVDLKYEMHDEVITPLGSLVPDSVVAAFRKK